MSYDLFLLSTKAVKNKDDDLFDLVSSNIESEDEIQNSKDIQNFFKELFQKYPETEEEFDPKNSIWFPPENEIHGDAAIMYLNLEIDKSRIQILYKDIIVLCSKYNLWLLDPQQGIVLNEKNETASQVRLKKFINAFVYRAFIFVVGIILLILLMLVVNFLNTRI